MGFFWTMPSYKCKCPHSQTHIVLRSSAHHPCVHPCSRTQRRASSRRHLPKYQWRLDTSAELSRRAATQQSLSPRESHILSLHAHSPLSLSLLLSLNQNRPVARAQRHARAHKNGASKRKGRHGARPKGRPGWRSASTWEAGAAGLASTNAPRPTQMTSSEPRWRCPLICVLPS